MEYLSLPLFDPVHQELGQRVARWCGERLLPLVGSEAEDPANAAVEYAALLGQEGLLDPAIGRVLEGESARPDLRALCVIRHCLGQTSGLCDAVFGAQVHGLFPVALGGDEDQRAVHLPAMVSGQTIAALALLDGDDAPARVTRDGEAYRLSGSKILVPLAPIADRFIVLARHEGEAAPLFSFFIVDATKADVRSEPFVSGLPAGRVVFDQVALTEDHRVGDEGRGLVIAKATLDFFRLATAAACAGLARQVLDGGMRDLLARGAQGRRLLDQQGPQWALAEALRSVHAAEACIWQAAWLRDSSGTRKVRATAAARTLAQECVEVCGRVISDLAGARSLTGGAAWRRVLDDARVLSLENEFLEHPSAVLATAYIQAAGALANGPPTQS